MSKLKLDFTCEGTDYVIWAWKGNYLNLGPGAEVGFYTQDDILDFVEENFHLEQWMVNESLPMTLSLYKVLGGKALDRTYYHWLPHGEQWWITGFNPNIKDANPDLMVVMSSIDFSGHEELFEAIKDYLDEHEWHNISKENMIFDEDGHTLWIMWDYGVLI